MEYLQARKHIRTGDILACEGTAIYSKIINFVTQSPISHVGIAVWVRFPDENDDRLAILEAHMAKGVRLAPLSDVLKTDYWSKGGKIHWLPLKDEFNGHTVAAAGLANWNKAYAKLYQFLILGSITIKGIRYLFNKSMDNDPKRMHCSELVTHSLMKAGFKWGKDPSITSPAEVASFDCLNDKVTLEECDTFNRSSCCNKVKVLNG